MTKRRQRFVEEYLIDLNATQAAIRAGFSAKTAGQAGGRLLKNAQIAALIAEKQQVRTERVAIDADYVLENLTEVVERTMQRAPVMVRRGKETVQAQDEDGNDLWQFDAQGAVKALALIAKHTGGFSDRVDVTVTDKRKAAEELATLLGVPVDQLPISAPALPS